MADKINVRNGHDPYPFRPAAIAGAEAVDGRAHTHPVLVITVWHLPPKCEPGYSLPSGRTRFSITVIVLVSVLTDRHMPISRPSFAERL